MIGPLLRNELRMLLRDTRTLVIAFLAPLIGLPAYILIANAVDSRETERVESATYSWALAGDEPQWGGQLVADALALPEDSGQAPTLFELRPVRPGERGRQAVADSLLRAGELELVVIARDPTPADSLRVETRIIEIHYRSDSDLSSRARERLGQRLERLREVERDRRYLSAGFTIDRAEAVVVSETNVASASKQSGQLLARFLLPLIVGLMLAGGGIIAADTISGEKERGTLETLLTTAASRTEIVRAKLLAIVVVGLAVVVINLANLMLYVTIGVLELPASLAIDLPPAELGMLLLLFMPLAGLVAAGLLLMSGVSKSYREYQLYQPVVFIVVLIPSLAGLLPGLDLEGVIAFIPVAGVAVATSAVLVGEWSLPWALVAWGSSAAAALLLLRQVEAVLSNERLISSAAFDEAEFRGGPALFPRHVISWFLGLWVLFFLCSLWFGEALGLRGQIVVNLVGVFLGGSAWIVRRYRLDPVEVLSLRAPGWTSWPAVAIGAPSFLVLAMGIAQLVNTYLFPIPQSMLEAFARGLTLDLGLLQVLFFLAVMPGVLEEIAFRGVLLHGLRKRLRRSWAAALACGAIFGVFHVSLFRVVPTGLLGVVLALVVIRTRSLYPAIAWHFMNNALALVPAQQGWIEPDAAVPVWGFGLAGLGVVTSFLLLRPAGARGLNGAGTPAVRHVAATSGQTSLGSRPFTREEEESA